MANSLIMPILDANTLHFHLFIRPFFLGAVYTNDNKNGNNQLIPLNFF